MKQNSLDKIIKMQEIPKSRIRIYIVIMFGFILCSCNSVQDGSTKKEEDMNNYKNQVILWYEAFSKNDPAILDQILSPNWVDIPAPPNQPEGPPGAKPLLAGLKTTFPDLKLTIKDIIQDGEKVVVRAEMTGTQKEAFMKFPSKNRKMIIQVVDIHEFKDGKIFRTWHTEDWMTGLHQLGVFEK